jgi:hypothetical protein
MSADAPDIARCLAGIETKLGWGDSVHWQKKDFELLSEKIFDHTNILLSASTLKRVWGKTNYAGRPSISTLNALAIFAGFENWRAFAASARANPPVTVQSTEQRPVYRNRLWMLAVLIIVTATGFVLFRKPLKKLRFQKLAFSNEPVTRGLPNTVVFHYDASGSNADSVFIQQSWDRRRRFKVDKQLHEYTSTYYIPGYYKAKLILDDSVVREQDVYIESQGWMTMVENGVVPVYLPQKNAYGNEAKAITEADLIAKKIDPATVPVTSISKVDKTINVSGNRFSMKLALQNTCGQPAGVCRMAAITLMGTDGMINMPVCAKGCTGEIVLYLNRQKIDGRTRNLSGFGVDFSREAVMDCQVAAGRISIQVNNQPAYEGALESIGRIVGVKIAFKGTGVLNHFSLSE